MIAFFAFRAFAPNVSSIGDNLLNCAFVLISSWQISLVCVMEITTIADNTANKTADKAIKQNVSDVIDACSPVEDAGTRA